MTSVYRERDRQDDSRSVASTRRTDGDRYTKVTRYVIREDDDDARSTARSTHTSRRRDSPEEETIHIKHRRDDDDRDYERETQTIRVTRREVEDDRTSLVSTRRGAPTKVARESVARSRAEEQSRSPRPWERMEDTTDRELVVRRSDVYDDGPTRETDRETVAVSRYEDRNDNRGYGQNDYRSAELGREKDLKHYTRTAEYYAPMQQPQTIIIRQDPIIIRERVRDDDYQLVKKSDVDEERSVATTRRDEPRDEEYFYEKKVRERFDDRHDDYDRGSRREISPHDSISQAGRRRDSYSSDDSMVYVKRVTKDGSSRASSRDNKKDLAAGVIAGVGAAELFRNHRKKEGKEASQGIGRIGRDVGAGAIGALAAEGVRRYRSKSRHGSRERSSSREELAYGRSSRGRDRSRRGSHSRSRSRSLSKPNLKTLGALGLGAVAVAAAASLATRKMDENKQKTPRRSRSRRRRSSRSSAESLEELENDPKADDARNPKKRNSRIAAAGAVGAAGAALLERARSRSKGREGSRERSRVRQGLPIAAAGLGTAALAGLYETNKAKREAKTVQNKQKDRARSQSGSRRSDAYYEDRSRGADPDWGVEYGHGDVTGNNYGPEYYGRAPPQEPFYGDAGAMVPATARTRSRSRSLSRDRRGLRSGSASSSDGGRRRSTSRGKIAAGAAAGAAAASEHDRRKAEKRERKARRRQESQDHQREQYDDAYPPQQAPLPPSQAPWTPPPPNDPYANQQGFGGPAQDQYQGHFDPPPGAMAHGMPAPFQPQYQPQYQPPAPTPQPEMSGRYTPQSQWPSQPPYNAQTQYPPPAQQQHYPPPQQGYNEQFHPGSASPYPPPPQNRGASNENVSAGHPFSPSAPPTNDQRPTDGMSQTRSVNSTPVGAKPAPAIRVQPPTNTSTPSLDIPQTYVPPGEHAEASTANETGGDRRVSFARSPDLTRTDTGGNHRPNTMDSDNVSPDQTRHQRRRQQDANRGYDASDDTDLSPNSERRASRHGSREQSGDRASSSRRSLNPEDESSSRHRSTERRRERRSSRPDRPSSPTDSDATIDLPARFDDKGRKMKQERGGNPSASVDDILGGKGAAGKVFGNFLDGLMGPDAKGRRGSTGRDAGDSGSQRRPSRSGQS